MTINSHYFGLRKNGLMGISLFFFYYARFMRDERYENLAYDLLEGILSTPHLLSYNFSPQFADIARTIDLLENEKFLEVETDELSKYFVKPLMIRLKADAGIDLGFFSGIIGICDFFLNKTNRQEALDITFKHIYSGLKVKGYPKNPINSLFLFPSEILRDVKLFFLKLEKANTPIPRKELLNNAIRKLESKKILQSNCPEYYVFQDLREAEIMDDKQKIQSLLEPIAANSPDLIFKGLAAMSLEDGTLPAWWKLI